MTGSIETTPTHQTLSGLPTGHLTVSKYIVTPSGNKVSKEAVIYGSQNIVLQGNVIVEKDCMIRGDLAHIRCDRHTIIRENCVIRPPFKHYTKGFAFFPMSIGSYSYSAIINLCQALKILSFLDVFRMIFDRKIKIFKITHNKTHRVTL